MLQNGELKMKRKEGWKMNVVWERFGEVVKEDDGSNV